MDFEQPVLISPTTTRPSVETKKRELTLEEKRYETTWRSCCGATIDSRALVFFSQFSIAIMVLSFCIYQLIHSDSCNTDSLYSSILTLVLEHISRNTFRPTADAFSQICIYQSSIEKNSDTRTFHCVFSLV